MGVQGWMPLVMVIAPIYGLPPELVGAIIEVESGGDPAAISSAGAVGLMQVMPREAGPWFADRPTKSDLLDPALNLIYGCRILRWSIDYYARDARTSEQRQQAVWRGVAAYYAGIGNVPKDGEIEHEGARKYVELVKGAVRRLFPVYYTMGGLQ